MSKTIKGLYKFYWDCGRMGYLEGVFIATNRQIANLIGKEVYFGEVLKYSDIYGTIEEKDIKLLTSDPSVLDIFETHIGNMGINPLEYMEE